MDSPRDQDSAYSSPKSLECSLSVPSLPSKSNNCLRTLCSITCTTCNNTFVNPKVLPCLHTFCASCIECCNSMCPECNAEFTMPPNGVAGLIPDYGIINFIASLRGSLFCNSCKNDNVAAVAKCINCDNFLCQYCVLAHNYMHCFEGHRVIEFPKEFFQDENLIGKEEPPVCLIHPNELIKHFCTICDEPVCQQCLCLEHSGHKTELIDNVGDVLMIVMKNAMDEMKSRVNELHMSLKYGNHTAWWLASQHDDLYTRINEVYDQYCALLQKHKENQLSVLESSYAKMKAALNSNNTAAQDTLDKIYKLNDFFSRLMKFSTTSQCLMFKKLLTNKHRTLTNYKHKPLHCSLSFVSGSQDFSTLLFNCFGHVLHDMNSYECDYANDPKLGQLVTMSKNYMSSHCYNSKYDKWSNSALDDLKSISDLCLIEEGSIFRPFNSIRSTITRSVITYNRKFGSYGTSQGQFTEPNGVCINAEGDIIIADTNNNRVQVFDKLGSFKFAFGESTSTGECSSSNTLLFPNRVAVMEITGDIVVTERAPTHQVQVYNQYGGFIRKFGANILQHPRAVTVDKEGHIIVVECKVMRVIIFDMNGNVLHKFTCNGTLHFPNGVAVNDRHEIFISDNRTHCVNVYDYSGNFLHQIGREGLTNYPIGVMLTKDGLVMVADNHNNFNLTVFTQDGQLVTALESKVKHAQCYDAAISSEGAVVLTSKDYRVYIYLTSF
ncbi:hypothetical protein O3M35_009163 [Rhynocoris fuscipes]|uniref:Brain tumor protein n=1 Tax=Rhynocoris fuscipes TaxID=488301 RepID=A0AAW1D798_9HEMI